MNINEIIYTEGKNTEEIENIIKQYTNYLVITDDKAFAKHFKHKFVDLLSIIENNQQLILHPSKFIFLAWQGLINVMDFEIIVISCEIKPELLHAFKVFYINKETYTMTKPKCIVFSNKESEDLKIHFQSTNHYNNNTNTKSNIKYISLNVALPDRFLSYCKCKRLLNNTTKNINNLAYTKLLEALGNLEKTNIDEAISLLEKCIDSSKAMSIPIENEDFKDAENLLKFQKINEVVKNFTHSDPVYIKGFCKITLPNVFDFDDIEINDIEKETAILLVDDDNEVENFSNFKKVVILKKSKEWSFKIVESICRNNHLDKFYNYITRKGLEYYTSSNRSVSIPTLSWEYSILFFEHVLYMIGRLFHDNYLYIQTLTVNKTFFNVEKNDKFYCCLEFPKLVDHEMFTTVFKSDTFKLKKDANKDVAYKVIIKMVETGFLDINFLPVKKKFIDENSLYFKYIKKVYEIDFKTIQEAHFWIQNIKEEYEETDKFRKDFPFSITQKDVKTLEIDEVLRKQANSLSRFTDTMSLYIFNNSNIGICTGPSFKKSIYFKNTEVSFIKEIIVSEQEKKCILNYQVVFFGINFKRCLPVQNVRRKYAYFVVPIKDMTLDFEYMNLIYKNFFLGSVYEVKDRNILTTFLLFNPITKLFFEFVEESDKKMSDVTKQKLKLKDKENQKEQEYTFKEYFTLLYGLNLKYTENTNIIFSALPYSLKKDKTPEYHSGEVLYVTTVKKSIKNDYKRFIDFFNIFETLALMQEFKEKMNFKLSLKNLAVSFTQKDTTDLGYERFEFIGDSVLKYSVSKFLFTECGYNLNKLVSTKDSLICNDHLYKIGRQLEIQKYFSFNKFSENLFQPPAILDIIEDKSLLHNLNVEKIFLNNNQYNFVKNYSYRQTKSADIDKGKKVYADIVESLIGVHYVELGFEKAWDFLKSVGILKHQDNQKRPITSNLIGLNTKIYLLCEYEGILPIDNIEKVEKIINYVFRNKGYLEKALIHPSYKNNIFGSERFQKLELVGDCFLDIKVSDFIFNKYPEADPEALHTHRKSLVNNHTFALILFKKHLFDLALTGLSEQTRDIYNKISKCYSDIFESLAGAVVLDAEFDLTKTQAFFDTVLQFMIENKHEC